MLGIFKTVMCTNNVRCKKYDSWFDYACAYARESQVAESCKKKKKVSIVYLYVNLNDYQN